MLAEERGRRSALNDLRKEVLSNLRVCYDQLRDAVYYFGQGTGREHGRRTLGGIQAAIKHFEAIISAAFGMDNMQDLVQEKVRKRQVRGARNWIAKLKRLENKLTRVLQKTDPIKKGR